MILGKSRIFIIYFKSIGKQQKHVVRFQEIAKVVGRDGVLVSQKA